MAKILGFKIWYSDHTEQGKTYKDWVEASDDDVQAIMLYFDKVRHQERGLVYRRIANASKYYALDKKLKFSESDDKSECVGHIKTSTPLADEAHTQLVARAMADEGHGFIIPKPTKKAGQ